MKDLLDPQVLFLIVTLAVAAWSMIRWPDIGLVLGVVIFYLNLPALATKLHGVPGPIAGASLVIFAPALIQRFLSCRPRFVIDLPLLMMFLFLASAVLSTLLAKDYKVATEWLLTFVFEGIVLYMLMVNLVRSAASVRRVTWALLFTGTLLASMTVYQEGTKNYKQEFGGLAQRMLDRETAALALQDQLNQSAPEKVRIAQRAQGPIDDPNRYSQMLLVLLPLGWVMIRRAPATWARWLAAGCSVVILAGVLLTYSRGAFLTLVAMTGLLALFRGVRWGPLLGGALLFVLVVAVAAPAYVNRIVSLQGLQGLLVESNDYHPDAVQRGRATEMLAAFNVFLDHPVLGVGPGQFSKVYSLEYMNLGYSLRRIVETRRAHSMLLELAAETGAVGVGIFLFIVWILVRRLLQLWRLCRVSDPEAADYGLAFVLSITAYMGTAVFLHLSYQRYYWFMIALASAVVHIARSEGFRRIQAPRAVPELSMPTTPRVASAR